jgi:aryl-alcohol dehydrogenase-like predicted oxidoreductase
MTVAARPLGRTGLSVPPLCFGGNVFGWTVDEAGSFALLDRLREEGFAFVDTADVYSAWAPGNTGGESETIIGRWLKARGGRDRMILATKVGSEMGPGRKGLRKAYIVQALEDSLRRLQTDYVDLYQSHWDDPETPFDETLSAYQDLLKSGKVRAIGASNLDAARLGEALAVSAAAGLPRYDTLQPHYNLVERAGFEGPLQDLCVREGIGVITYFSLASGFLTGKYRSAADFAKSARGEGMAKYLDERGHRILKALDEVAAEHDATQAQVALAWLMGRPSVVAPIASATLVSQLDELLGATRLRLSPEAVRTLDATGP